MAVRLRKSSARVTLVLIGVAALSGCGGERRDVYASREDCLADWGNKPQDCTPATDPAHRARGWFYGSTYSFHPGGGYLWTQSTHGSSRAIGSTSSHTSRGGFGASARSSGG